MVMKIIKNNAGAVFLAVAVLVSGVFWSSAAFGGGAIKIGMDTGGEQVVRNSDTGKFETFDVRDSASMAFELGGSPSSYLDIGAGLGIQAPRELKDYPGKFYFMPIYGYLRIHPELNDIITPYLAMQLGVSMFFADDTYKGSGGETRNGMHLGFGGGIILDRDFLIELLYTVDTGEVQYPSPLPDFEIEYSKLTLSMGFLF